MKPQCAIGQVFGGNATATYKAGGVLGHTGIDNYCGYGTNVNAYWGNEYVYKVLTKENPSNDGSGFTGVFTLVDDERGCFEFLYGHCDPTATVGQILPKGGILGTEANNGEVYSGTGTKDADFTRITLAMQKAGDHRGSHRHDQMRTLLKEKTLRLPTLDKPPRYLFAPDGSLLKKDGFYFHVPDYYNGYNGCVDWTKITLPVAVLEQPQHFLDLQSALYTFQVKEGIKPYPQVGNLTKKALNKYLKIKYEIK